MYDRDDLSRLAAAYAAERRLSLRTVSKHVFGPMNDKTFIRLAEGHGCYDSSLQKASRWFDANADRAWWPDDVPWPIREAAK